VLAYVKQVANGVDNSLRVVGAEQKVKAMGGADSEPMLSSVVSLKAARKPKSGASQVDAWQMAGLKRQTLLDACRGRRGALVHGSGTSVQYGAEGMQDGNATTYSDDEPGAHRCHVCHAAVPRGCRSDMHTSRDVEQERKHHSSVLKGNVNVRKNSCRIWRKNGIIHFPSHNLGLMMSEFFQCQRQCYRRCCTFLGRCY
jgi:hypothetical protein